MKRIRKLLGVILIISAFVVVQLPPLGADAASVPEFSISGSGTLLSYNGTRTDVVIPSTVIEIATDAFRDNDNIRRVTIPNSVRKVNEYAFWDCDNLETVSIGAGLNKIDDFVFANCMGLVSINIPANVTSIGIYAFEDDVNLESVTITENTHIIHDSAFDGCYKLVIFAPEGSYAWEYAQGFYVRQAKFPVYEDTGMIDDPTPSDTEDNANGDSSVGEDGSDEYPAEEPGAYTTQYEITQRPDGTYTAVAYNENTNVYGQTHVVGNSAVVFMDNSALHVIEGSPAPEADEESSVNIPSDTVIYSSSIPKYTIVDSSIVADKAYYMSGDLENMSLPQGITEIGQFSFARTDVVSVTLPDSVVKIDYGAFYHCARLGSVSLPQSVMKIEPYAFSGTPWVEDFMAASGSINNNLDSDLNASGGDFLVSGGALVAYRGHSTNVTVPSGVRIIVSGAFKDVTSMKSLSLPSSLISIGEEAFMGCSNLEEVSFGGNEEEILDRAFAGTNVSVHDIPDRIACIGLDAFDDLRSDAFVTYEESAQRLSNSELRSSVEDKMNAGVTVTGTDGVQAYLDGADRHYTLNVTELSSSDVFERALNRANDFLNGKYNGDKVLYDLTLTDSAGIPISKLGNQGLEVAIPIPESLSGKKLVVLTVDRNGQLEDIPVTVVDTDGTSYARFTTYHLSVFALCSTGDELADSDIITSDVTLRANSGGPAVAYSDPTVKDRLLSVSYARWIICGMLVLSGAFLILVRKKVR
ncbi:MAG: leucine-rich repeat domain-containing protein [Lachnospiraceae bacterium]|nr:leucine-rich repeat domain-containing protein [Lachnospiraceae bacterium]